MLFRVGSYGIDTKIPGRRYFGCITRNYCSTSNTLKNLNFCSTLFFFFSLHYVDAMALLKNGTVSSYNAYKYFAGQSIE